MKKIFSLIIFITCLVLGIRYGVHCINEKTNSLFLITSDKHIIAEIQKISKEEMETIEEQKISGESRETLDAVIKRLLRQIDANMAEEYWLFKTQRITKGTLSLDIYVDNTNNIERLVIVPSDKVAFLNEKGDEFYFFYITEYDILNGNIEGLVATSGRYLDSWENVKPTLNDMEKIMDCQLNYVETVESYEWPQAKQPDYRLEDLESTEIYQNFELYITKGFYFPERSEVYLGLWTGYSNRVRMMYKTLGSDEKIHYYSTEMNLNGQRCNFINETTEEMYERFKLISVKMR